MLSLPLLLAGVLLFGCGAYSSITGGPTGAAAPATIPSPGAPRWVLIRNLRDGATMAEPEYVWVAEDRVPTSATTRLFGKQAVLGPPESIPEQLAARALRQPLQRQRRAQEIAAQALELVATVGPDGHIGVQAEAVGIPSHLSLPPFR